jgi:amino acid permease
VNGSNDDKDLAKKLTPWQAGLNVGKCCVGAGCFILPNAFKNVLFIIHFLVVITNDNNQ